MTAGCQLLKYGPGAGTSALSASTAAATDPVRETLGFGQVNLLLVVLIYADFMALRNRARLAGPEPDTQPEPTTWQGRLRRLWHSGATAGVGVGLATAIKLT